MAQMADGGTTLPLAEIKGHILDCFTAPQLKYHHTSFSLHGDIMDRRCLSSLKFFASAFGIRVAT